MTSQKTYTEACGNFDKIYDEAISSREPIVVTREGSESVSVIPTAELNSIMETAYLFESLKMQPVFSQLSNVLKRELLNLEL
jgi:antitoxin YefM